MFKTVEVVIRPSEEPRHTTFQVHQIIFRGKLRVSKMSICRCQFYRVSQL